MSWMPGTNSTERPISVARPTASSIASRAAMRRILTERPARASRIHSTTAPHTMLNTMRRLRREVMNQLRRATTGDDSTNGEISPSLPMSATRNAMGRLDPLEAESGGRSVIANPSPLPASAATTSTSVHSSATLAQQYCEKRFKRRHSRQVWHRHRTDSLLSPRETRQTSLSINSAPKSFGACCSVHADMLSLLVDSRVSDS